MKIDASFAKEEQDRRKRVMDRAHQLRYNEKDETKQFHSKIRLFEVLEVFPLLIS
jgi:hypothetical protein